MSWQFPFPSIFVCRSLANINRSLCQSTHAVVIIKLHHYKAEHKNVDIS